MLFWLFSRRPIAGSLAEDPGHHQVRSLADQLHDIGDFRHPARGYASNALADFLIDACGFREWKFFRARRDGHIARSGLLPICARSIAAARLVARTRNGST